MNSDETSMETQSEPSGSPVVRMPVGKEWVTILITLVGAGAVLADYLPPKYAAAVIIVARLLKLMLDITGQSVAARQGPALGQLISEDIKVANAKKPM